jgi:hypothetical protein
MTEKYLLIVAHAPSPKTAVLRDALRDGAQQIETENLSVRCLTPFEAGPDDVLKAQAIILMTPENLGYMSGALKDFFDRIYYPCLEKTQGMPYALVIRAGNDGTGTARAVSSITTGLRWRAVRDPLICLGEFQSSFTQSCHETGAAMAAGLDAGIF